MNWLNDLDPALTPAEEHFLRRTLARARSLESRTRGTYAESLLCELLPGATASEYAAEAFDLEWPRSADHRVTVAVRTSGSRNSDHDAETKPQAGGWDFPPVANWTEPGDGTKRRCWADVAVLCFHDGWVLSEGWRFYVLTADQVEQYPAQRLTTSNLASNGHTSVGPEGLPAAVDAVAQGGLAA
jgi:hypothetical protein